MATWIRQVQSALCLEKFRAEELRRLDEKLRMMKSGAFDDRAKQSDQIWRDQNSDILDLSIRKAQPPEQGDFFK